MYGFDQVKYLETLSIRIIREGIVESFLQEDLVSLKTL